MTQPVVLEPFFAPRADPAAEEWEAAVSVDPAPVEAEPESPPEPEIDAEAERRACLSRIAEALEAIARDQSALRTRCITDAAKALGAAAESLLPRMADAGLAALVAEAADRLTREGRWPCLELRAAAEDAEDIASELRARGATSIQVRPDQGLAPGSVSLEWEAGGAEIDAEAIVSAALDQFERALARIRDMEPEI